MKPVVTRLHTGMTKLLTSKEAAAALGISKSTLSRYVRTGKLRPAARTPTGQRRFSEDTIKKYQTQAAPDPTQSISRLAPGGGSWLVNPAQTYAGIYRGGKNFYVPSDLAIRTNREDARRMWNNLTIREALQSRLWASAEQAGHVEAEDKLDKRQLKVAAEIQRVIDNIPDFLKLKYCLLKSRFFGCYGVQLQYKYTQGKLAVHCWSPVHGDSIIFKQDSDDIGIYTTMGGGPGVKKVTTEAGYIGRAHVLDDGREVYFDDQGMPYQKIGFNERQAFILMTYDPDPSDFLDPRAAGGVKGLGIRSTVYPTWYYTQELMGNLLEWTERCGTGLTLYKFLWGNESSYNNAKELAESNSNQAVILVPVDPEMNGGKPLEGVERIEPSAVGMENMLKIIEEVGNSQIRRFIVGQDSTSRPANMGLGSKIAEVHESTFSRIVAFDCQDLAQTLTSQLVSVLQEWNHPDAQDFKCKYIVDVDSSDVERQMRAIKDAYEIGVAFDEDEVRGLTGCAKPDSESIVLRKEGTAQQAEGDQAQPGQEGTDEQAETAATGELAQTVGGLQAIAGLQQSYYEGKIPQEACVNNVVLLFGFTPEQAASLFPEIPPEKLTEDQGVPGQEQQPEADEGLELFRYGWSPYQGPKGGHGWKNDQTGDIVYGDKPGGDQDQQHEDTTEAEGPKLDKKTASKLKEIAAGGFDRLKKVGAGAKAVEHVAQEFLANGVDERIKNLPAGVRHIAKGAWMMTKLGTKAAFATYTAGQALAEHTAQARGATPEQAAKLRGICTAIDLAGAKAVPLTLSAIGLGGVGAAASFFPAGSLAYLAYSTARNPLAVIRGARAAIKAARTKKTEEPVKHRYEDTAAVERLLEWIMSHDDEESLALVYAAIDEADTLDEAIDLAERASSKPEKFEADDADVKLLAIAEVLTSEASDDQKRSAIHGLLGKEAE